MSPSDLRQAITTAFESAREVPGAPYDPDRFLAFFIAKPAPKGNSARSGGWGRFIRFMEAIQLEHAVCFTWEEWERGYSLDDFVALVAAKVAKPRNALRLARERLRVASGKRIGEPIKFGLFFSPFLVGVIASSSTIVRVLLFLPWFIITGAAAYAGFRDFHYAKALVARIERELGQ